MTTKKQPEFTVGEKCYVRGMHRNYKPTILSIEYGRVTVCTPELPGSERAFKLNDIEKISTAPTRSKK